MTRFLAEKSAVGFTKLLKNAPHFLDFKTN